MASFTRRGFIASTPPPRPPPASRPGRHSRSNYPTAADPVDLPVGRGRRHRCDRAHRRARCSRRNSASRSTSSTAPAARASSATRRSRRRAPDGYTLGIITVEITHDALAGPDRADAGELHAARAHERRPARRPGARRLALQDGQRARRGDQGAPAGKLKASGTGQGGIWHLALVGWLQATWGSSPTTCRGCRRTAPRRRCRISSPAASISSPARCPKRARMIDAGKAQCLAVMATGAQPRSSRTCRP